MRWSPGTLKKTLPAKTHPTKSTYNTKILSNLVRWFLGSRPCFQNTCESIRENLATKVYTPWPLPWHGPTRPPWLCYLPLYLPGTEFCIELLDCNELLVAGNRLQERFFSRKWVNYFERYNQQWLGKSCFGAPNTAIVSYGKTKSLHQRFSNIAWQPIPIVFDKHGTKTP